MRGPSHFRRQFLSLLLAGASLGVLARTPARAQAVAADATQFVVSLWLQAYDTLAGLGVSDDDRARRFQALLNAAFDVPLLAQQALGRYWPQMSESDRFEYLLLFEENLVLAYADRFREHTAATLRVVLARAGANDEAQIASELPRNGLPPLKVGWRLRRDGNTFRVVDLGVDGVSMVQTMRDDFSAVIQRAGGRVNALLEALREKIFSTSQARPDPEPPPPARSQPAAPTPNRTTPAPLGSEL